VKSANNVLLLTDTTNNKLKVVDLSTKSVTTIASSLNSPNALYVDANEMVYVWTLTYVIYARSYSGTGNFSIIAGALNQRAIVDGQGTTARFTYTSGATGDTNGNIYFTDRLQSRILNMKTENYVVTTVTSLGGSPESVVIDTSGNLYVSQSEWRSIT
jgi:hypothetical protein